MLKNIVMVYIIKQSLRQLSAISLGVVLVLQTACTQEKYLKPHEEVLDTYMIAEAEMTKEETKKVLVQEAGSKIEPLLGTVSEINTNFNGDSIF